MFHFHHRIHGDVLVRFSDDIAEVEVKGKTYPFENKPRKWGGAPYKPCLTHCVDLVKRAMQPEKKPTGAASRRQKESRPQLKLVTEH